MALVTSKDFQLVPDVSNLTQQLSQALGQRRQEQQAQQKAQQTAEAEKLKADFATIGAQMLNVRGMGDFTTQRGQLAKLGQEAIKRGEDATLYTDALNISNQDELNLFLTRTATAAGNADKLIAEGLKDADAGPSGLASAKTEILESGASILVLPNEDVIVKDPLGNQVTGQARLDVLNEAKRQRRARQEGEADITVSTARRVEQVKKASATADKAFGMVESLRQNITNLKEVVPLIGSGANTGPISQLFPSIKAETVRLENLQKRLSLDVVGAVTFGALSKGELDLAKAVAIPLGLEGDELIKWTNDSIAAKEKLANYFEEQAIFLGQGNTQADWLKLKKAELKSALGGATEADIRATMKANNMTRPQVLNELKRRASGGT